jgi:endoglucanase
VFKMNKIFTFAIIYILTSNLWGQSRPFPQNTDYPNGYKSLVITTTVIQNAYYRWKNSFLKSCNGIYRVSGDDTTRTISEGMGYGMILTAYFGEKEYFDGLFEFYKSKRTSHAYNLMAWDVTCDRINDPGSATDGDLDVAYSLIVAYYQWGENYLDEAKTIISILKEHYFVKCESIYTMKPGGYFGGCGLTDISYYTPAYFHIFAKETGDVFWDTVANDSYKILNAGTNDSTGLVPDWQSYNGVAGGNPSSGRTDYYRYDASRVPWRMSLDYLWNGDKEAQEWCIKITDFAASIGASNIVDGYNLDGSARGQYNNSAFVGGFAVGAMCNSQSIVNSFAQRLLILNNSGYDNQYFNLSLRCIYMLVLTGNFWQPGITTSVGKKRLIPDSFHLEQNYPNPFNPSTTITYKLNESSNVILSIYNSLGQRIKVLSNSFQNVGEYSLTWDATDTDNIPVASGIYFYEIETDKGTIQKKMVLIK